MKLSATYERQLLRQSHFEGGVGEASNRLQKASHELYIRNKIIMILTSSVLYILIATPGPLKS